MMIDSGKSCFELKDAIDLADHRLQSAFESVWWGETYKRPEAEHRDDGKGKAEHRDDGKGKAEHRDDGKGEAEHRDDGLSLTSKERNDEELKQNELQLLALTGSRISILHRDAFGEGI